MVCRYRIIFPGVNNQASEPDMGVQERGTWAGVLLVGGGGMTGRLTGNTW